MKTRKITLAAVIAAIYALLTIALAPASFGSVQCRISEALCVLPLFFPEAVWGLSLGCLIANLSVGNLYDIVLGTFATCLAAWLTRRFRKNRFIALLFPVLLNALVVGGYIGLFLNAEIAVRISVVSVGIGEAAACYGLGLPLSMVIQKRFYKEKNHEN